MANRTLGTRQKMVFRNPGRDEDQCAEESVGCACLCSARQGRMRNRQGPSGKRKNAPLLKQLLGQHKP